MTTRDVAASVGAQDRDHMSGVGLTGAVCVLMLALARPAFALGPDDTDLLRQLGFVAGQAVACDIEQPDVAARVATAMADAIGVMDEASHRLLAEQALLAAALPCAAPAGRLDDIKANWRLMRKRAGLE